MIVVTGGSGFIGSVLVWKLNSLGIRDIVVVDRTDRLHQRDTLRGLHVSAFIEKDEFRRLLKSDRLPFPVKTLFHLGASSSTYEYNTNFLFENNTLYTRELAEWALARDVRFIYASSGATYGDGSEGFSDHETKLSYLRPLNSYGWSKHRFDLWARNRGLFSKMVGLKFFNVYGPHEFMKGPMTSVVYNSFQQIKNENRVRLFKSYRREFADGEQVRDFVYVKDCAEIMWWFSQNPHVNGLFNVGTGAGRTWNDLARAVFEALERPVRIDYVEMPENLKAHYQYKTCADVEKLKRSGCPTPRWQLEDGVIDYVRNFLRNTSQLSF